MSYIPPALYFTDDEIYMIVYPDENWSIGDILNRVITANSTKVYKHQLIGAEATIAMRQVETTIAISIIENYGPEALSNVELIFGE